MTSPRTVTRTVDFEGEQFTLVFDFEVIADFEEGLGISIGDVLNPPGGGSPMLSRLAKLLLASLRRNHPDADLNLAGAMLADPKVKEEFFGATAAAMPKSGDIEGAEGNAPAANRKARRAATSRSAGKTGSSPRPKRG